MARIIKKEEVTLLWSSDGSHLEKKEKIYADVIPSEHTLKIRLEKNQRGGKTVSVLFELPDNPEYFKELLKELKASCGSGGALKEGNIEIQGDHRDKIKNICEKRGFKVKLAGG